MPFVPLQTTATAAGDRVGELVGTWTCRAVSGERSRLAVLPKDTAFSVTLTSLGQGPPPRSELIAPAPGGGWTITSVNGASHYLANAPAWTGDLWTVIGETTMSGPSVLRLPPYRQTSITTYRLGADGILIRQTRRAPAESAQDGDACARGDAPPPEGMCAIPNAPAVVMHAVLPDTPVEAMRRGITGVVRVRVELDANGAVTQADIAESPSPILDAASLASARASRYRAEVRDCKRVPSSYIFTVTYSNY